MTRQLANEAELYFERGGPTARLVHRLALRLGVRPSMVFRIVGFLLITWVPLLCFALLEGRALGATPQDSLLLDFATYARFFLAVPLLIVAERVVGPRLTAAATQFIEGELVRREDDAAFDQAIAVAAKRRESLLAEAIIVVIALLAAWYLTAETFYQTELATWRSPLRTSSTGERVSLTGLWYHVAALPILQFFFYRWMWRLAIWACFLWTVARLPLDLVATHADQAGGLGFLGTAHTSLSIFGFGLSAVFSAEAAHLNVFRQEDILQFRAPYIAMLVLVELVLLGPLLVFCPVLFRTRLAGLRDYSLLVLRYNRAFHQKWITGPSPQEESLLGTGDIQSLADLGTAFDYARSMKVVPFSLRVMLQIAVITSLPCLPLLLLAMPIGTLLDLLAGALL